MKVAYETRAQRMYNALSDEMKQKCKETYDCYDNKSPELWEDIVEFWYDRENAQPVGWFKWWED